MATKNCPHCGAEIDIEAKRCYICKEWISDEQTSTQDKGVEFLPTLLFAYFWGVFGIHNFYAGNIAVGVAQALTFGGCGIWTFIDIIRICFNKYRDGQNRLLRKYDMNIGITVFVLTLIPLGIILFCLTSLLTLALTVRPH